MSNSAPEPMGGEGTRYNTEPVRLSFPVREAYALEQLVSEVTLLFPETVHEFGDQNSWKTSLSVTFDVSEQELLGDLLSCITGDQRVRAVTREGNTVKVLLHASLRTQDLRDRFGLDEAFYLLLDKDEL